MSWIEKPHHPMFFSKLKRYGKNRIAPAVIRKQNPRNRLVLRIMHTPPDLNGGFVGVDVPACFGRLAGQPTARQ